MTETAKPRTEVLDETRETLHVVEQKHLPRPQKTATEQGFFDGAHEVRFTERSFRPRHGAALDEIRAFIDALEVRRREIPPLPEAPVAVPVAVPAKIPEHYRAPLERVIQGALVKVETVHRVGTGVVVDVEWEADDEGARRGLYLIEDDAARPYDAVASKVDELPAPAVEPAAAPTPAPAPAPTDKKRRFGFGKKEKPEAPADPAPPPEETKKKGLFRRGK